MTNLYDATVLFPGDNPRTNQWGREQVSALFSVPPNTPGATNNTDRGRWEVRIYGVVGTAEAEALGNLSSGQQVKLFFDGRRHTLAQDMGAQPPAAQPDSPIAQSRAGGSRRMLQDSAMLAHRKAVGSEMMELLGALWSESMADASLPTWTDEIRQKMVVTAALYAINNEDRVSVTVDALSETEDVFADISGDENNLSTIILTRIAQVCGLPSATAAAQILRQYGMSSSMLEAGRESWALMNDVVSAHLEAVENNVLDPVAAVTNRLLGNEQTWEVHF